MMLAVLILSIHLLVIAFNLFGLIAIPLGAWRGWQFVHMRGWRLFHIATLGITALQAVLGQACFLTVWESKLGGGPDDPEPLIMEWANSLIYWNIPIWVFATVYAAVFLYALALLWLVPMRPRPADWH